MCQQTQVSTVIPFFLRWMKHFPTWQSLADADEAKVLKLWEGLGYYNRARRLHKLAVIVANEHAGYLPDDMNTLKTLPGIGNYTAGAIASIAYGKKTALVDGNVERVLCRIFNIRTLPTSKLMWALAESVLPQTQCGDFNQALMELGATVCTPRKPQCKLCPQSKVCCAKNPESLPKKNRVKITSQLEQWAWIVRKRKLWLEKPVHADRWKGFYRLPLMDLKLHRPTKKLLTTRYSITRYRVRVELWECRGISAMTTDGKFFSLDELKEMSLPAPHRKVIQDILLNV
jgi:A/G-specific adenine glycosylase